MQKRKGLLVIDCRVSYVKRVDMTTRNYNKAMAHLFQDSIMSDSKQSIQRRLYSSEMETNTNEEQEG